MKKFLQFIKDLVREIIDDDLYSLSAAMTYKLLLSIFPALIFLITLVGFFSIDSDTVLSSAKSVLPDAIFETISGFIYQIINTRNPGVLSISLAVALFSTTSGIVGLIHGLNKAYNTKEKRNFIQLRLVSFFLLIIFLLSIISSLALLVFGTTLLNTLVHYNILPASLSGVFNLLKNLIIVIILMLDLLAIYKFSVPNKAPLKSLLPGSITAGIAWFLFSLAFNVYINNFSNYSKIYGSIAGVFILILWINIISYIILIGGEINALMYRKHKEI